MEFVEGLGDVTGVPRVFVTRVGAAKIIDNSVVSVVLCTESIGDETPTIIPVIVLDWTVPSWCMARDALKIVREEIDRLGLPQIIRAVKPSKAAH